MTVDNDIVFLSWGGDASRGIARVLQCILQRHFPGANVFFSETSIEVGDDPIRSIFEESLNVAKTLVAILTKDSANNPWVIWETATAFAKDKVVVPLFVGVEPRDIPGPLPIKIEGVSISNRKRMDDALNKIGKVLGINAHQDFTDDEWHEISNTAAAAVDCVAVPPTLPEVPAEFKSVTLPLNNGIIRGTLLAVYVRAYQEIDEANAVMTLIIAPSGAETMPFPARLFWHPSRQVSQTIAQGASDHIMIARSGPDVVGAVMDSPDQRFPWSLSNGAWRIKIQFTAKGFAAKFMTVAFVVNHDDGLMPSIKWTELIV